MSLDRRTFCRSAAFSGLAIALGACARSRRTPAAQSSNPAASSSNPALYGPLVADPAGLLDLSAGFQYRILESGGSLMSDGFRVPGKPDGMGLFELSDGSLALLRNHELDSADAAQSAYPPGSGLTEPAQSAHSGAGPSFGAVTRLRVDPANFTRLSSNLVLTGTDRNCAGGLSPWGWLSCEESTRPGCGFVYLCSPDAATVQAPQRIDAYGRCRHEAVVIDPLTNQAFLTEDQSDSALYRFLPSSPSAPFQGQLQTLRILNQPGFDLSRQAIVGQALSVDWVTLSDPTPSADTLRAEAASLGAARIERGEGLWFDQGKVYISATTGGTRGIGQVFVLDLGAMTLTLLYESGDPSNLELPDNLTIARSGDIYLAEDGSADQYIRVLEPGSQPLVKDFARVPAGKGEIAGLCFAPNDRALFLNLFGLGLTLVVTGPFR